MKRPLLFALIGILACGALVIGGGFALLHSPFVLNRVGRWFGFDIRAEAIALSPTLSGSISGLTVTRAHDGQVVLVASNVTAKNSLELLLKGEIESLELRNPKFTYRLEPTPGGTGWESLKDLPTVRFLHIQNAEVSVTSATGPERMHLTRADLTVRNLSSAAGGSINLTTAFAAGYGDLTAKGTLTASFQLTGVYPRPTGKGAVRLAVDSGTLAGSPQAVSLNGFTLAADLAYDKASDTLAVTSLRGQSQELGAITGAAKAVLKGDTPWTANVSAVPIEFAKAFAVLKPFLPEAYRDWTMQGKGTAEVNLQGTYVDRLAFGGTLAFGFEDGGFSSPDSSRAAQGMTGRLVLKLQYAASEKLAFTLQSEARGGEYLWGAYYNNLDGRRMAVTADGLVAWGADRRFECRGDVDLFQTGSYGFEAAGMGAAWTARIRATNISHAKLVETFLPADLQSTTPSLKGLSVTGRSSLLASLRHDLDRTTIGGTFQMADTTVSAPGLQLTIQDVAADLPFQLVYPLSAAGERVAPAPGSIRFQAIQRRRLTVESLTIPVTISANALEVPQPIVLPFFGGEVHVSDVRLDDVLFPTRLRFAVLIAGVDLGRLTRRLAGVEYPGTVNADFGQMEYVNGRVASAGRAVIGLFGGEIEMTNFYAERIGSPTRTVGGDIVFRNISLQQLTQKITIGSMSGVIQGSLHGFAMESGQPASFTLVLESVDDPHVAQWISVDAIESISILGTGVGSPLNNWITQFFKDYPYRRIGIWCRLHNDAFTIRGLIQEGGKEYLVRRALLRGVDVVNQNPDNVISFQDMAERIERIWSSPGPSGERSIEVH
jgi:hypothetical protein